MPMLGKYRAVLDAIAFVYRTRDEAAEGQKVGGTGFFVAVPSVRAPDKLYHTYVVTNFHVARGEPRTLRVNTRDGGVDLITVADWTSLPNGPDVAVAPIALDTGRHAASFLVADSWFLAQDECSRLEIDAGDDVFMVGRFVDYDGLESNKASVRFGPISMADARIRQEATGYAGRSFVIDMHSRTGYSGSPVFVYRTHGSIFAEGEGIITGGHTMRLLGIHWGQFPERWELSARPASEENADPGEAGLIVEGRYVKGLSGMTCVIPAWDIQTLLAAPQLAELRARAEAELLT